MKQYFLLLLLFSTIIASCGNKCISALRPLSFINFSNLDTDTIIIRRFIKSNNFLSLIDTIKVDSTTNHYQRTNDTLLIYTGFDLSNVLPSIYDYEIYLPEIKKTYQITDIYEDELTSGFGIPTSRVYCKNLIKSYKINGKMVNKRHDYDALYITK